MKGKGVLTEGLSIHSLFTHPFTRSLTLILVVILILTFRNRRITAWARSQPQLTNTCKPYECYHQAPSSSPTPIAGERNLGFPCKLFTEDSSDTLCG